MALRTELHVLVVDDMSVSRQILVQLLERFGVARIELAGDVDEAIAVLARRRVHVVISDLNMPGRDGIDAVTLASVAAALGVRSPSLYNHIAGLDGLRRELALHASALLATCSLARSLDLNGVWLTLALPAYPEQG